MDGAIDPNGVTLGPFSLSLSLSLSLSSLSERPGFSRAPKLHRFSDCDYDNDNDNDNDCAGV
jgi:hypothetical protein